MKPVRCFCFAADKIFILLLLSFFLSAALPANLYSQEPAKKDSVNWVVRHFPPLYILEGDYKGQGIADQMLDLLIANLPEYQHEKIEANNKRAEAQIRKGEKYARLTMLKKPDREEYMHYSIPHYLSPSHRLIIRKDALHKIQGIISPSNEVSLEEVLKIPNMRVAVEMGRSVGETLDTILKKYEGQKNISVIPSPNTEKTLEMLAIGNIECIIEYPATVTFFLKKKPESMKLLSSIVIKEAEPWVIAYAVAPKNEWGYKLIQKINAIFKKEIPTETYRNFTEQWLDESSLEAFRIEYQKKLMEEFH